MWEQDFEVLSQKQANSYRKYLAHVLNIPAVVCGTNKGERSGWAPRLMENGQPGHTHTHTHTHTVRER